MRILPWCLVAPALVAQAPAPPQASLPEAPLFAGERAKARKRLSESRQAFVASIEGLSLAQWVLPASGHTARHTLQMNEVKRSPGFPAVDR